MSCNGRKTTLAYGFRAVAAAGTFSRAKDPRREFHDGARAGDTLISSDSPSSGQSLVECIGVAEWAERLVVLSGNVDHGTSSSTSSASIGGIGRSAASRHAKGKSRMTMATAGSAHLYFVLCLRCAGRSDYVLWYTNTVDGVYADDQCVLAWQSETAARQFARDRGFDVQAGISEYSLGDLALFLAGSRLSADAINDWWNLFEDLANSVGRGFEFEALQSSSREVYERVFGGTAVAKKLGFVRSGSDLGRDDLAEVRTVLRFGYELLQRHLQRVG